MKASIVRYGSALRTGSALTVLAVAGLAAVPAYAADTGQPAQTPPATTTPQNTTSQTPTSPDLQPPAPGKGANASQTTPTAKGEQAIVITGTVSRQTQTASPVTVVSAANLQDRGITTVADAIQSLSANNAGTAPPSWTAWGFATGASAPSLRGFNDAYTVTLFDGLRSAVYPLADDGFRNFVDINSIPESIIDRVEVLQDGASANYGADAVAGVVNVIVKREIQGIHVNGSYGISSRNDYGEKRFDATLGYGSLADQGFNIYVNGEYQKNDPLHMRDRGYPFNTADESRICKGSGADLTCGFNGIVNGTQYNGDYLGFGTTPVGYGIPYTAVGVPAQATPQWQLLNPSAGCNGLPAYTLTQAQFDQGTTLAGGVEPPSVVCQNDTWARYFDYQPKIERKGLNIHGTVNITPDIQAYAMANWYEAQTDSNITPLGFTGSTTPGGTRVTVSRIYLPVYVCPTPTANFTSTNQVYFTGCDATNGILNPNNPFAAQGQLARLSESLNQPREGLTDANTYRFSGGVSGTVGGFNFNVEATTSRVDLDITNKGYPFLKNLLNAIGTGSYNFVDQSLNTPEEIQFVMPDNHNHSTSKLTEIQAVVGHDIVELPGGTVNLAVGATYRTESLNNPSANPANEADPQARYYGINAVGAIGSRNVWSAYYSLDVPAFTGFDLKAEGRYDHYNTGQKAFSPKFELQYRPVQQLKLRGTYSRGFRVPSFNEAYGLPTTGYVGGSIDCTNAAYLNFCNAHGYNGTTAPSYFAGGYSYGLTSVGNPSLAPEKSQSWTAGAVITPNSQLTLTVDYWHTKIKNIIIPASASSALIAQYYNCAAPCTSPGPITLPPGVSAVLPAVADPNFPDALPLLGFIQASYENADSEIGSGVDLTATGKFRLTDSGIRLISSLNASYLGQLTLTDPTNGRQPYAGTLGPCNTTSCSGAPRWRGQWTNTIDFNGNASITATAYYTSGYSEIAADNGGILGDCNASAGTMSELYYDNSPMLCHAKAVWDFDLTGQIKLLKHLTLYGNVLNVFDIKPPFDPNAAYGLYNFNPAWGDRNFVGRYFRIGARVDF
jgi:iron complex outermembrane receptor protein